MTSRPISKTEEEYIKKVNLQGGKVNVEERTFFILEGTNPTMEMKVLKSFGYIGQFEIR